MRLLPFAATILLAFISLQAAAFEKTARYRNLKVEMVSDKPLTPGTNRLKLKVLKGGMPLDDAKVALKIFMPAMPGMPYMESKTVAKPLGDGLYEATFNTAMGGTWQVYIFVTTKAGKKYRIKTSLNL
ncbi:FixH family protein [Hydrogenimonas cancrithermarum]|uniref:Copper resistance determinant, crdA n=1 Tax=Hydrogenimonas cancrithermarum TaxID=2993563 RepID=A0ABM8FMW0_9BACT|nr:FixH family protein [Hydrogenimonas cancrithermarum]BDY13718.1 copper resistance determinant, crdA [Hydrogenimonas cancrithermarum]